MNNHLVAAQSKNITQTYLYISIFLCAFIGLGYFLAGTFQNSAILWGFTAFSVGSALVAYWKSDQMVLKMHGAKEVTAGGFYDMVSELASKSGMPMPKVYTIQDDAMNAFATGRNPEHAAVCATTGILAHLSEREMRGVMAHELSHVQNRDTLIQTVVVVLVGVFALLADSLRFANLSSGESRIPAPVVLVLSLLAPLSATLIQLAISRRREFLADASGALLAEDAEGLASALEKIAAQGKPLATASTATAHLFIANPFGRLPGMAKLFATHPPMEERVRILRGIQE